MDPLSIIASLAGISTAGTALSGAIYDAVSTFHHAPTELRDIARAVADLSIICSELRRVLRKGVKLYKRRLLRQIQQTTHRIDRIHAAVHKLIDDAGEGGGLSRLKWVFRRSKVMQLLSQVEKHKTGISLMLNVMILALETRRLTTSSEKDPASSSTDTDPDAATIRQDAELARKQAEGSVKMSYQDIRDLVDRPQGEAPATEEDPGADAGASTDSNHELQLWKQEAGEVANWLYFLVFAAYVEASGIGAFSQGASLFGKSQDVDDAQPATGVVEDDDLQHLSMIIAAHSHVLNYAAEGANRPISGRVVDELLDEWTSLTEAEIDGTPKEATAEKESATEEEAPIRFKDAVGRKYRFPYSIARKWDNMEELIREAFMGVEELKSLVQDGRYDLTDSNGQLIWPGDWERVVKPGQYVMMSMWPIAIRKAPEKPGESPKDNAPRRKKRASNSKYGNSTIFGGNMIINHR